MEYSSVPIEQILAKDTLFKISTGSASAELVASIRLIGLLNPPILIACSGDFRIVSGFKRIAALRQLGISSIPARLLDPGTPVENCIRIAIIENSSQRSLNLVEQANAIGLLATFCTDAQQLADAACSAGLSVNPGMAEKLNKLAGMEAPLKAGVLDGTVALPVAIQIHDMKDAATTQAIGTLLKHLGLSLNRQREILEWIVSICRRDAISVAQLLMTEEIVNCMQDTNMDRRQKGQLIRKCLKTRRYPTIQSYENRFDGIVKKLKLAKGTSLIPPPHFENPSYGLRFEFRNYHELLRKLKEFEKIIKSEILKSLWDDPSDFR
jgi:ParB family transcriptional regulator, chromosome partitioning protein